jgi:preprotein translocase subunit YajC
MNTKVAVFVGLVLSSLLNASAALAQAVPADGVAPQVATAAGTPAAALPGQQGGVVGMVAPILLMFAVFYFMLIRPQNKKMKEQKKMQEEIKVGDDVLLNSGFIGKITGMNDRVITVEFEGGARAKVLRNFVHTKGKDILASSPAV